MSGPTWPNHQADVSQEPPKTSILGRVSHLALPTLDQAGLMNLVRHPEKSDTLLIFALLEP